MQLARAAAARTPSDPATVPHANPAPRRAAANVARLYTYKPTDPAVLFTRLAATVRDCIALEAPLVAGPGPRPRATSPQPRADPRRAPVREAFRDAIKNHPDRAELQRETTTRLDEELTADPDKTID